jgi:uncharacterized protein YecT (DUF1311 family)
VRILAAFLLCVVATATAAFAAEAQCNTPEKTLFAIDCKLETQQGLDQCYRKEFDHSEEALDEAYDSVMDRFQGERDVLELAKEAWKVNRNAECLFIASKYVSGSIYPTVLDECKIRHNRAQECRLKNHFLNCKERDPLCPAPPAR